MNNKTKLAYPTLNKPNRKEWKKVTQKLKVRLNLIPCKFAPVDKKIEPMPSFGRAG